ncbi:hypothetical protein Syun_018408 [Stephania yunnanensis]|uniref:Uncharacterized protein n=1 Tax=Stephania yunnanensis TaxID=152371 RepID=A0AAP0NYC7_9MAGN
MARRPDEEYDYTVQGGAIGDSGVGSAREERRWSAERMECEREERRGARETRSGETRSAERRECREERRGTMERGETREERDDSRSERAAGGRTGAREPRVASTSRSIASTWSADCCCPVDHPVALLPSRLLSRPLVAMYVKSSTHISQTGIWNLGFRRWYEVAISSAEGLRGRAMARDLLGPALFLYGSRASFSPVDRELCSSIVPFSCLRFLITSLGLLITMPLLLFLHPFSCLGYSMVVDLLFSVAGSGWLNGSSTAAMDLLGPMDHVRVLFFREFFLSRSQVLFPLSLSVSSVNPLILIWMPLVLSSFSRLVHSIVDLQLLLLIGSMTCYDLLIPVMLLFGSSIGFCWPLLSFSVQLLGFSMVDLRSSIIGFGWFFNCGDGAVGADGSWPCSVLREITDWKSKKLIENLVGVSTTLILWGGVAVTLVKMQTEFGDLCLLQGVMVISSGWNIIFCNGSSMACFSYYGFVSDSDFWSCSLLPKILPLSCSLGYYRMGVMVIFSGTQDNLLSDLLELKLSCEDPAFWFGLYRFADLRNPSLGECLIKRLAFLLSLRRFQLLGSSIADLELAFLLSLRRFQLLGSSIADLELHGPQIRSLELTVDLLWYFGVAIQQSKLGVSKADFVGFAWKSDGKRSSCFLVLAYGYLTEVKVLLGQWISWVEKPVLLCSWGDSRLFLGRHEFSDVRLLSSLHIFFLFGLYGLSELLLLELSMLTVLGACGSFAFLERIIVDSLNSISSSVFSSRPVILSFGGCAMCGGKSSGDIFVVYIAALVHIIFLGLCLFSLFVRLFSLLVFVYDMNQLIEMIVMLLFDSLVLTAVKELLRFSVSSGLLVTPLFDALLASIARKELLGSMNLVEREASSTAGKELLGSMSVVEQEACVVFTSIDKVLFTSASPALSSVQLLGFSMVDLRSSVAWFRPFLLFLLPFSCLVLQWWIFDLQLSGSGWLSGCILGMLAPPVLHSIFDIQFLGLSSGAPISLVVWILLRLEFGCIVPLFSSELSLFLLSIYQLVMALFDALLASTAAAEELLMSMDLMVSLSSSMHVADTGDGIVGFCLADFVLISCCFAALICWRCNLIICLEERCREILVSVMSLFDALFASTVAKRFWDFVGAVVSEVQFFEVAICLQRSPTHHQSDLFEVAICFKKSVFWLQMRTYFGNLCSLHLICWTCNLLEKILPSALTAEGAFRFCGLPSMICFGTEHVQWFFSIKGPDHCQLSIVGKVDTSHGAQKWSHDGIAESVALPGKGYMTVHGLPLNFRDPKLVKKIGSNLGRVLAAEQYSALMGSLSGAICASERRLISRCRSCKAELSTIQSRKGQVFQYSDKLLADPPRRQGAGLQYVQRRGSFVRAPKTVKGRSQKLLLKQVPRTMVGDSQSEATIGEQITINEGEFNTPKKTHSRGSTCSVTEQNQKKLKLSPSSLHGTTRLVFGSLKELSSLGTSNVHWRQVSENQASCPRLEGSQSGVQFKKAN